LIIFTGKKQLYLYSISKAGLQVIAGVYGLSQPVFHGDRIIWIDGLTRNLLEYRLGIKQTKELTSHGSQKAALALHGDRLVWADDYNKQWAIYSMLIDEAPPELIVTAPEEMLRTNNSLEAVKGFAEPGSSVKINGTAVTTDPSGNFSQVVKLVTGNNDITVTAADEAGNTTTAYRTIYYYDDKLYGLVIKPDPVKLDNFAAVKYTLSRQGYVTVNIFNEKGEKIRTISENEPKMTGSFTHIWDGTDDNGRAVPDGKYRFVVEAGDTTGYIIGRIEKTLLAARVPGIETDIADGSRFNPANGEQGVINYTLSSDALVSVTVYQGSVPVKILAAGEFQSGGKHSIKWDGRDNKGNLAGDASYTCRINAVNPTVAGFKSTYNSIITIDKETPRITNFTIGPDPLNLGGNLMKISFTLSENARVTAKIVNSAGKTVCTVLDNYDQNARNITIFWDGRDSSGKLAPDGVYKVVVSAADDSGKPATTVSKPFKAGSAPVIIKPLTVVETDAPTVSQLTLSPSHLRLGASRNLSISFKLSKQADVTIKIFKGDMPVWSMVNEQSRAGINRFFWDGKDNSANDIDEGTYTVIVSAVDASGKAAEARGVFTAGYLAVTAAGPENDATGVSVKEPIVITFSDPVEQSGFFQDIRFCFGSQSVPFNYRLMGNKLTLIPTGALFYGTAYTVTVPPGAVKDLYGNDFKHGYTLSFTTEEDPGKRKLTKPEQPLKISLADSVSAGYTAENGETRLTVSVDEAKALSAVNKKSKVSAVIIPAEKTADITNYRLTGSLIKALAKKDILLEFRAVAGALILPADELSAADQIAVVIARDKSGGVAANSDYTRKDGLRQIITPVEFKVEASAGEKKTEIGKFRRYADYIIYLPEVIDAGGAIGVVLNSDNTINPVPTRFEIRDGKVAAVLKRKNNGIFTVVENRKTFGDISAHWAREDINILAAKMIISGVNKDQYAPDNKVTRAQFAVVLARALGLETGSRTTGFSDIGAGDWYAAAVGAVVEAGMVGGYSDGTFRPNAFLTREEAAVAVVAALKIADVDMAVTKEENKKILTRFKDRVKISPWAIPGIAAAAKNGIIGGNAKGFLAPGKNLTRAELAVIIGRMLKKAGFM